MTVCLSPGGPSVYRSEGADDEVMVATAGGIIWLSRHGSAADWAVTRRALDGVHVTVLLDDRRGRLYAGTHGRSIFLSEDEGISWNEAGSGIAFGRIYCMNLLEVNGRSILFAGTEPAHLFRSEDAGEHWDELPRLREVPSAGQWTFPAPPHEAHVKHVSFEPGNPDVIYAAIEQGGLLKSEDGGSTWRDLSGFYVDVHRIAIHPDQPDHVYIATGNGIFHSLDAGGQWHRLTDKSMRVGYPDGLIIHPDDPVRLYTAGAITWPREWADLGAADARPARSFDSGLTWEVLGAGLPEHRVGNIEALAMNVWPEGCALYGGTTDGDVVASLDGGNSWFCLASGLPPVAKNAEHYKVLHHQVT